jgi:hypothetical protein
VSGVVTQENWDVASGSQNFATEVGVGVGARKNPDVASVLKQATQCC